MCSEAFFGVQHYYQLRSSGSGRYTYRKLKHLVGDEVDGCRELSLLVVNCHTQHRTIPAFVGIRSEHLTFFVFLRQADLEVASLLFYLLEESGALEIGFCDFDPMFGQCMRVGSECEA